MNMSVFERVKGALHMILNYRCQDGISLFKKKKRKKETKWCVPANWEHPEILICKYIYNLNNIKMIQLGCVDCYWLKTALDVRNDLLNSL